MAIEAGATEGDQPRSMRTLPIARRPPGTAINNDALKELIVTRPK